MKLESQSYRIAHYVHRIHKVHHLELTLPEWIHRTLQKPCHFERLPDVNLRAETMYQLSKAVSC